jgi:hypothetical protein
MSEKNEAGLNKLDMQAVIAAWIVANDGCGGNNPVDCYGYEGIGDMQVIEMAYKQQKAEAAEAEKRKVEAARKDEQHDKGKSVSCGNCANFSLWSSDFGEDMKTSRCAKKGSHVPAGFTGCPDFEPGAKAKRDDEDEYHADAIIYNGILISTPSQEDKLRHKAWLLEIENSHRLNDIERLKTEAAKRTSEDAERIAQLEKEVFKAQKLRGEAIERYSGLADKHTDLADKCERLTEQRNRLANDLIKATRRVKEVERENAGLRLRSRCEQIQKGCFQPSDSELPRPAYRQTWKWRGSWEIVDENGESTGKITFL